MQTQIRPTTYLALLTLVKLELFWGEHSGSVVEFLTQGIGAAGSSLTGFTVLCA